MSTIRRAIGVAIASVPLVLFAAGTANASSDPDTAYGDSGSVAGTAGAGTYHVSSGTNHGDDAWYETKSTWAGIGGAAVHHQGSRASGSHEVMRHGRTDNPRTHQNRAHRSEYRTPSTRYHDVTTTAGPAGATTSGTESAATHDGSAYHNWATTAGPAGAGTNETTSEARVARTAFQTWPSSDESDDTAQHDAGSAVVLPMTP